MIVKIEPLEKQQPIACGHPQCYGHYAKWLLPQLDSAANTCCSVHLARYAERIAALPNLPETRRARITVQIVPFANPDKRRCDHPRCDGRAAKWTFPQTNYRPHGPFHSCSVHLPRFCEIVQKYHLGLPAKRQFAHAHRTAPLGHTTAA